ncbi:MAG: homocysteine S-methyltransferase family protein [Bacillota bacterium]
MNSFLQFLASKIIVVDGAMGTLLQARGLPAGACPESYNLTNPEIVAQIHRDYLLAGADIATANTFGAIPLKLKEYGLEKQTKEINLRAIQLARKSFRGENKFVAGSMGPLGKFIEPLGELSFDEAYEQFALQANAFEIAGADLVIIETIGELSELRAAILAAVENFSGPVLATMTFEANGRTFTGTDPLTAAVVAERLGITAFGANCSLGSEGLLPIAKKLVDATNLPILISPNAGLPEIHEGKTIFKETPEIMAENIEKYILAGVGLVGSCCGSTPAHTKLISEMASKHRPQLRAQDFGLRVASRSKTVTISTTKMPIIIGERINPTGKKALSQEIREGKTEIIRREAIEQVEAGAHILDVNLGVPGTDESSSMEKIIPVIQSIVDVPLMIDSTNPKVVERALKSYCGKAIINSVNGEEESLDNILPLAKKYGAAVLALALDERGLPETAEERLLIIGQIAKKAEEYGIPKNELVADCLVLTASAQPEGSKETLKSLTMVREELGIPTSLGVSNVSFGLPNRPLVNKAFYAMALAYGLDAAIINPLDQKMMDIYAAANVLTNRDSQGAHYIDSQKKGEPKIEKPEDKKALTIIDRLQQGVLLGDSENITQLLKEALNSSLTPFEIFNQALIPGIEEVGKLFGEGVYFLPQLIASSDTMTAAFQYLKPEMEKSPVESLGTIVLATVKGDIHDIGKNIFAVLLKNHGYNVIDLGRNVDNEVIIKEAKAAEAQVIALSALMTTTMPHMEELIKKIAQGDLDFSVIVGGAAVNQQYAEQIGADGYAPDAIRGVDLVKSLFARNQLR